MKYIVSIILLFTLIGCVTREDCDQAIKAAYPDSTILVQGDAFNDYIIYRIDNKISAKCYVGCSQPAMIAAVESKIIQEKKDENICSSSSSLTPESIDGSN